LLLPVQPPAALDAGSKEFFVTWGSVDVHNQRPPTLKGIDMGYGKGKGKKPGKK